MNQSLAHEQKESAFPLQNDLPADLAPLRKTMLAKKPTVLYVYICICSTRHTNIGAPRDAGAMLHGYWHDKPVGVGASVCGIYVGRIPRRRPCYTAQHDNIDTSWVPGLALYAK